MLVKRLQEKYPDVDVHVFVGQLPYSVKDARESRLLAFYRTVF